jgi:transposase InsO family protein
MGAALALTATTEVTVVCTALGLARAGFYRWRYQPLLVPRPAPPRALPQNERRAVCDVLGSERFADQAPAEIYATLLDEGVYLCSIRTMYRILADHAGVRERRAITRHGNYKKPELLATGPNQVWSWDITKLMGPAKWTYFYLYVILDIFSRRVVGWCVADRESAELFRVLFEETLLKHDVPAGQLTVHADRGGPMKAKSTAQLMADLGVTKTHSRPHTSNDNPFSESAFKTLKYQPEFPTNFGCKEDASTFCRAYFAWYNEEHHHSALGLMTPNQIHHGQADAITTARQAVLDAAFAVHPERFVSKPPIPPEKPGAVWINPPPKAKKQAPETTSSSNDPILVTPQRSSPDSTGGNRSGPQAARPITLADGGPEWEVPVVPRGRPIAIGHRPQHPNEPTGSVLPPPRDGLVEA